MTDPLVHEYVPVQNSNPGLLIACMPVCVHAAGNSATGSLILSRLLGALSELDPYVGYTLATPSKPAMV